MNAEFIKLISELRTERFNVHLGDLVKNQTPCGIFFGFKIFPANAAANIQMLLDTGINISCAIVLADVQADALKPLTKIPVITLEDFPRFSEKNFPVKLSLNRAKIWHSCLTLSVTGLKVCRRSLMIKTSIFYS